MIALIIGRAIAGMGATGIFNCAMMILTEVNIISRTDISFLNVDLPVSDNHIC